MEESGRIRRLKPCATPRRDGRGNRQATTLIGPGRLIRRRFEANRAGRNDRGVGQWRRFRLARRSRKKIVNRSVGSLGEPSEASVGLRQSPEPSLKPFALVPGWVPGFNESTWDGTRRHETINRWKSFVSPILSSRSSVFPSRLSPVRARSPAPLHCPDNLSALRAPLPERPPKIRREIRLAWQAVWSRSALA
jgi:hypothetical protein